MRALKQNRRERIDKQKKYLKSKVFLEELLKVKYFKFLKVYASKSTQKAQKYERSENYSDNILKMKVLESLKHYAFELSKQKLAIRYRGLRFWSKN